MDLLKHYVDILRQNGVREYGFELCLEDYRFGVLFCLLYSVIIIGTLLLQRHHDVSRVSRARLQPFVPGLHVL